MSGGTSSKPLAIGSGGTVREMQIGVGALPVCFRSAVLS